jgi:hypothetical protein
MEPFDLLKRRGLGEGDWGRGRRGRRRLRIWGWEDGRGRESGHRWGGAYGEVSTV